MQHSSLLSRPPDQGKRPISDVNFLGMGQLQAGAKRQRFFKMSILVNLEDVRCKGDQQLHFYSNKLFGYVEA